MITKTLDDLIYSFWDIECDRLKLVIMDHFLPFYPIPPSIPPSEKQKKIILHMCTKNHNHIRYGS